MKPKKLIEIAETLDPEKEILCQVVGQDGGAWNMEFSLSNPEHVSFNVLTISHPDLKKLPGFVTEADKRISLNDVAKKLADFCEQYSVEITPTTKDHSGITISRTDLSDIITEAIGIKGLNPKDKARVFDQLIANLRQAKEQQ